MLERWCASVAEFAVLSLSKMRAALREKIGSVGWRGAFTAVVELAPLLSRANFSSIVSGSDRLAQRYLSSLQQNLVMRRIEDQKNEKWECLDAMAHWERVRNFAAATIEEAQG
jgi:hypothetical protein